MSKQPVATQEYTATMGKDQLIALMDVYLSEWMHRDELLWTQVFKLFYANLIVIVLPNIAEFIGIELPQVSDNVFPLIGIFMALVFLYISTGYTMRLKASSKTYAEIMKLLGDEKYERISIKDKEKIKGGYLFSVPMANVLVIAMFLALEAIAVVLLIVS